MRFPRRMIHLKSRLLPSGDVPLPWNAEFRVDPPVNVFIVLKIPLGDSPPTAQVVNPVAGGGNKPSAWIPGPSGGGGVA